MKMNIFWNVIWAIATVAFDSLPHFLQKGIAKRKCCCAAQYVKRYINKDAGFVILVEILDPSKGLISDHVMNTDPDTGEFFDLYGNRIPGTNIGEESSFRSHSGHRYVTIAFADKWEDFGFEGLIHALEESRELNDYLFRTRG